MTCAAGSTGVPDAGRLVDVRKSNNWIYLRLMTSRTTPATMTARLAQLGMKAVSFSATENLNGPNWPSCVSLVYSKWP